ncbi:hypothetical protein DACRYDRAFT_109781 [Dacryopinax primogenitus]|uniref:HMG box domain-containing protein n=1 Tax=Dacryopinax primogenitus (strain DJM 731) TaxID=1858805 RepID=M5FVQ0_DACPD|nr:uncharacterized protein DACRYDRAFT_109781 [Dacryopinax primogenitus]EJT99674.1 hypothetical protein DACRYDRAFT_109781 [Dacryopinax primogenitus]
MLSTLFPRVIRLATTLRHFAVTTPRVTTASRHFAFPARAFAAAATVTKRKPVAAKSASKRSTAGASKSPSGKGRKTKAKKGKKPGKRVAKAAPKKRSRPVEKKVKEKLPQPPARPAGPYGLFTAANSVKYTKPPVTQEQFRQAASKLAADWQALPVEEKQVYYDDAARRLSEYHVALSEWSRDISYDMLRKINKQRRAKKQRNIRLAGHRDFIKPSNPYLIFVSDQRAIPENWDGAPASGIARQSWFVKKAASQWKKLSDAERATYVERAAKHNVAYRAQKAEAT